MLESEGDRGPLRLSQELWWAEELTVPLTSFSAQESRPFISPGQNSRAELIERDMVNNPENLTVGDLVLSLISFTEMCEGERCSPRFPPHL